MCRYESWMWQQLWLPIADCCRTCTTTTCRCGRGRSLKTSHFSHRIDWQKVQTNCGCNTTCKAQFVGNGHACMAAAHQETWWYNNSLGSAVFDESRPKAWNTPFHRLATTIRPGYETRPVVIIHNHHHHHHHDNGQWQSTWYKRRCGRGSNYFLESKWKFTVSTVGPPWIQCSCSKRGDEDRRRWWRRLQEGSLLGQSPVAPLQ